MNQMDQFCRLIQIGMCFELVGICFGADTCEGYAQPEGGGIRSVKDEGKKEEQ